MTTRTAERRLHVRIPAVYTAVLYDTRNRKVLARGRTANISEMGVLLVVRSNPAIPLEGMVCLSLTVPANPDLGTVRQVSYRCRVARRQEMGNMLGLGLEFLRKLS